MTHDGLSFHCKFIRWVFQWARERERERSSRRGFHDTKAKRQVKGAFCITYIWITLSWAGKGSFAQISWPSIVLGWQSSLVDFAVYSCKMVFRKAYKIWKKWTGSFQIYRKKDSRWGHMIWCSSSYHNNGHQRKASLPFKYFPTELILILEE